MNDELKEILHRTARRRQLATGSDDARIGHELWPGALQDLERAREIAAQLVLANHAQEDEIRNARKDVLKLRDAILAAFLPLSDNSTSVNRLRHQVIDETAHYEQWREEPSS